MRRIVLFLSLIFSLSAFADVASSTALNLLSRNGSFHNSHIQEWDNQDYNKSESHHAFR